MIKGIIIFEFCLDSYVILMQDAFDGRKMLLMDWVSKDDLFNCLFL